MRHDDEPPEVDNPAIDDDQRAMASLMGIDVETADRAWTRYLVDDAAGLRIERCPALVGLWRGQLRIVSRHGEVAIYTPQSPPPPLRRRPVLRLV